MPVVVISRQVGSYGDEIAKMVAADMGLELIGRDGLHKMALNCEVEYRDACKAYEREHGPGFFERIFFDRPPYFSLFESMAFEQASRGNVVIIGRGAQIVLWGFPGVFSARVVAPFETRVARMQERFGISSARAEDYVKTYDRERRSLLQSIFMVDLDDWELYNVIFNTHRYTARGAATALVEAVKQMPPGPAGESMPERFQALALAKRVETAVKSKLTSVEARNIRVEAEPGGILKITGVVTAKRDKEKVEETASKCPGVTKVENELVVMDSFRFLG
ncbi:MAG: cytidylate kinase family protein [Thermodesulfobacteriota bacterium]